MLDLSVLEKRRLEAIQGNLMNLNDGTSMIFPSHKRLQRGLAPTGCLLLVALWASSSVAQTSPLTPFDATIRYALSSNPKIQAAQFTLEATRERYHQTLAALLPEITLNASQSHSTSTSGIDTPTDSLNPNNDLNDSKEILSRVGLSATQPLLRWPLVLALQQTSSIIAAVGEDLSTVKNSVLLEAIQAIITFLLTENMEKLAEKNLTFTQRNLAAAESRRKAGYITQTDVNQATARVATAKAELIRAKNEAKTSRALFEEVTGLPVPEGLSIPKPSSHLLDGTLPTFSAMIVNRPDIKASKFRLASADYSVRMEKAGHLPIVNLTADATTYQSDTDVLSTQGNRYSVTVQLSLPIFSGGRTLSKTRESLHLKASAQADMDRIQNVANREVNQSYLAMYSAQASVIASEAAFKFYDETLKGIGEEFNAGFRTVIDLLEAQNQRFRSETDLVKNHFELTTSQYQLLHTVGRLTLENLQVPEIENRTSPNIPTHNELSDITNPAGPQIQLKKREIQTVSEKWGLRLTRWLSRFKPQTNATMPIFKDSILTHSTSPLEDPELSLIRPLKLSYVMAHLE